MRRVTPEENAWRVDGDARRARLQGEPYIQIHFTLPPDGRSTGGNRDALNPSGGCSSEMVAVFYQLLLA